jgi:TIR domain
MPLKIFCCYAHEDEALLNKLKAHLKLLQRQGLIDLWHDRDISAGAEWEREISKQLNEADIILLLVSPDFMNSDYCYSIEMQRAIERHEQEEAHVIPIILRPVYWQGAPFGKLQALPTGAKSVTGSSWRNMDAAFLDVTEGVQKVASDLINIKSLLGAKDIPLSLSISSQRSGKSKWLELPTNDKLIVKLGHLDPVVLKLSSYKSLRSLIDDLYKDHMYKQYQPYTYGKDWILYSKMSNRLIVSWSWLLKSDKDSLTSFDPAWAAYPPEAYGLMPGTELEVINQLPINGVGVATNEDAAASILLNSNFANTNSKRRESIFLTFLRIESEQIFSYHGKVAYGAEIHIERCNPEEVNISNYKYTFIFRKQRRYLPGNISYIIKSYTENLR